MTSPAIVTTAPTSVPTPTASPTALPTEPPVATVPAGPAGEVLLFEDFQDGVANGWIADADDGNDLVGMWQVVSDGTNSTYQELTEYSDDSWAVGGDVTWTDQAVEAVVSFTSAASLVDATVSLAVRFQSRESYYFVQYRGDGTIKIRKRFEGSTPELSSVDNVQLVADLGQTFTLKFQAQGTTLSVFANNFMVSSVVDTDLASGGVALAVVDGTAAFDNVTVTLP